MNLKKRLFDFVFAFLGLLVLTPLLLLVSLLIWIEDRGPVLFRQWRIGLNGKPFQILKFRSMIQNAENRGSLITVSNDRRVTRIGVVLRKTKLDELPQLINVLRGEMSFVGPRPEVSRYVELYNQDQRQVLKLMPGITDLASIKYRHESELLASSSNPEKTYIEEIMPDKIRINLVYAENSSLLSDIRVILRTIHFPV